MKMFLTTLLVLIATNLFAAVNFTGDLRLRHQTLMVTDQTSIGSQAFRFRLNAEAIADEHFTVYARLVTGTQNPIGNEQPLTFGKSNTWLDRAYVSYECPKQNITALAGKMPILFDHTPVHFDEDLNFDGFAFDLDKENYFVRTGGFWINEGANVPANQGLLSAQCGTAYQGLSGSLAYYHYVNLQGKPLLFNAYNSFGNTVAPDGTYANEYHLVDGLVSYAYSRFFFLGNYIHNTSIENENQAWTVGGEATFSPLTVGAFYAEIEQDAIVAALTDDESGGGTDIRGFLFTGAIAPTSQSKLGARYYNSTVFPDCDCEFTDQRILLDLTVAF
ncbi:MAG: putative porin [Candidatus Pacearchaeota archaeon]